MSDDVRLKVVLCWHMHQPQYRDPIGGQYQLPWTYLHAVKDYVDMAVHLEAAPAARAVINFTPVLLEQIADYAQQIHGFLARGEMVRDPLLAALGSAAWPVESDSRLKLVKHCLHANKERLIQRFPAYKRLADAALSYVTHPETIISADNHVLADLLVWYHLAWFGETVRRGDKRIKRLMDKADNYTFDDRRQVLEIINELLSGLIGRYAQLAERGQVELSITPYAHPIMPLLLDFECAREAAPDVQLPHIAAYPNGEERVRWHIRQGIETFRNHFGYTPVGCWPSEGAVSLTCLKLLADSGFAWAASGEGVLRNSLIQSGHAPHAMKEAWLYRPYAVAESGATCFFRDDGLSDLIGFTYAGWHADDAVNDLIHHLENIVDRCRGHPDHVVSIIMDGENAWEHYPENGYYFLSALYQRLTAHPQLELTTFSDYLETHSAKRLPTLVAGSWVHGTFSTWIGDPDKNRGWEMLMDGKHAFDAAVSSLPPKRRAAAERQLAICEGSDWFWWFGGDNPVDTVSDFERLYRLHLTGLYRLLGQEPPEYLSRVFAHGHGKSLRGGAMRPGQEAPPS